MHEFGDAIGGSGDVPGDWETVFAQYPQGTDAIGCDETLVADGEEEVVDPHTVSEMAVSQPGSPWAMPLDKETIAKLAAARTEAHVDDTPEVSEDAEQDENASWTVAESKVSTLKPVPAIPVGELELVTPAPEDPEQARWREELQPVRPAIGPDVPYDPRLIQHGVWQFDEAPNRPAPERNARFRQATAEALKQNEAIMEYAGDGSRRCRLYCPLPDGMATFEVRRGGERLHVTFYDVNHNTTEHIYQTGASRLFRRDHDTQTAIRGVPPRGDLPESVRQEIITERIAANKPIRELARELGLDYWKTVGDDELLYITRLLNGAREVPVSLAHMEQTAIRRLASPILPDEAASRLAAGNLTGEVYRYLQVRGRDPLEVRPPSLARYVPSLHGVMEVIAGLRVNDGGLSNAYVDVTYEGKAPRQRIDNTLARQGLTYHWGHITEAIETVALTYEIIDGLLTTKLSGTLYDPAGHEICPIYHGRSTLADNAEVYMVRNFLIRPYYQFDYLQGRGV
jgi:hypothetical protein